MRVMVAEVTSEAHRQSRPMEALVHADALHQLAWHLTRNPSDAEDLVQETYSRALQAWSRLTPGSNVKAWLFRILRNTFVTRYRQDARHPPPEPYDTLEASPQSSAEQEYLRGDLELERMRRLVGEEIEQALDALPEEARTVILLDLEGFTHGEIALVAGCAVGTVKSRLSRARAALRTALAGYGREVGK